MALKLHDTYGFKYDDASGKPLLRVLLGGWNTWMQQNAKDPAAYPIGRDANFTPGASTGGEGQIITATVQLQPQP